VRKGQGGGRSKMPDIKENVPAKEPGSGSCEPESSEPTQEDENSSQDNPSCEPPPLAASGFLKINFSHIFISNYS
uniref:Uncharacterized protein n=1 Tax=Spermophilus dauricus TaxID=99837 RepID=A0A8C9QAY1_SPEDA